MTYTVNSGENLSRIATKTGVSVDNLMKYNNLTSDVIHPGQVLKLKEQDSKDYQLFSNTEQDNSGLVKPGAYYLSYPGHKINLNGQVPGINKDRYIAAGHAGVVIVGDDGKVTQYDYGRYPSNYGAVNEDHNEGNWKQTQKGTININNTTYAGLLRMLRDTDKSGASPNVRLTYSPDVDASKVVEYIEDDANNLDRATYGIGPFAKAKWKKAFSGEQTFSETIKDLCTSRGCAQSAYSAIKAGSNKPINNHVGLLDGIKELLSTDQDGIGSFFRFSPRNRERSLQKSGFITYDSNENS